MRLASHCLEVAALAEEKGGYVATKGGMPLVGMVARIISTKPEIGAKNLYKQVCETLGSQPNRGKAPNSREVRKIVTALKEDKGLDMVMSFINDFTPSTMRAKVRDQETFQPLFSHFSVAFRVLFVTFWLTFGAAYREED